MLMPSIFGESLFDDFDNLMNFSFPDVDKTLYGKHAKNMMKTDVKEKDNGYEVAIDLPGFKKDELHLELNDGYLTISAEKGLDKDEKDSRSFYVGENMKEEDIHAKYENGILTLDVPKEQKKAVPEKRYIAIEG